LPPPLKMAANKRSSLPKKVARLENQTRSVQVALNRSAPKPSFVLDYTVISTGGSTDVTSGDWEVDDFAYLYSVHFYAGAHVYYMDGGAILTGHAYGTGTQANPVLLQGYDGSNHAYNILSASSY